MLPLNSVPNLVGYNYLQHIRKALIKSTLRVNFLFNHTQLSRASSVLNTFWQCRNRNTQPPQQLGHPNDFLSLLSHRSYLSSEQASVAGPWEFLLIKEDKLCRIVIWRLLVFLVPCAHVLICEKQGPPLFATCNQQQHYIPSSDLLPDRTFNNCRAPKSADRTILRYLVQKRRFRSSKRFGRVQLPACLPMCTHYLYPSVRYMS